MRYPKPGSIISAMWEDGGYGARSGPALVLHTSRHATPFSGDPLMLLAKEWGTHDPDAPPVVGTNHDTWRSVTQREITEESHDFCPLDRHDAGDWCSAGQGQAWVEVTYPIFAVRGSDVAAPGEGTWHCEADAVGLQVSYCSPDNPIHSSPCGWTAAAPGEGT